MQFSFTLEFHRDKNLIRLHKAGMIEDDDEEVSDVTSDTERKIGFQPNEE